MTESFSEGTGHPRVGPGAESEAVRAALRAECEEGVRLLPEAARDMGRGMFAAGVAAALGVLAGPAREAVFGIEGCRLYVRDGLAVVARMREALRREAVEGG